LTLRFPPLPPPGTCPSQSRSGSLCECRFMLPPVQLPRLNILWYGRVCFFLNHLCLMTAAAICCFLALGPRRNICRSPSWDSLVQDVTLLEQASPPSQSSLERRWQAVYGEPFRNRTSLTASLCMSCWALLRSCMGGSQSGHTPTQCKLTTCLSVFDYVVCVWG
jgi:hypothetical protein